MNIEAARTDDEIDSYRPDDIDLSIIRETQAGLLLVERPYHILAEQLGIDADEVMQRMTHMLQCGVIRRIGIVPNHYKLGYTANGMSVWDVPDDKLSELGNKIGQLDFVSHCYHRPRHLPMWPYNLFAMVHGKTRDEVYNKVQQIADMLDDDKRDYQVLFSSAILKKTGLRIGQD